VEFLAPRRSRKRAQFVRSGGDLCLICHRSLSWSAPHEELVRWHVEDRAFDRRVAGLGKAGAAFRRMGRGDAVGEAPTAEWVERPVSGDSGVYRQCRLETIHHQEQS